MKRLHLITVLALAALASAAAAKPMWEIADRWRCDLNLHMIADLKTQTAAPTGQSGSFEIDFVAGTRGSPFVDMKGKIVNKQYLESAYGAFNMLVIDWNGNLYPGTIIQNEDEWWQTSASGYTSDDGTPWIAGFKCIPQQPS